MMDNWLQKLIERLTAVRVGNVHETLSRDRDVSTCTFTVHNVSQWPNLRKPSRSTSRGRLKSRERPKNRDRESKTHTPGACC